MKSDERPMDGWYTYREVAKELGIPQQTIYMRIKRGSIRAVCRGSTWFVSQAELDRIRGQG
jgi:excisionase family DNA binding protein